jgi:hypothetical protein
MSATHASLIVILLSAILAVLLFGREAVFDSASTFLWVVGGSFLLAIVWLLARAFFVEVPKDVISDLKDLRQTGKPWIAEAILIVGLPFGVVWIGGMMAEKYLGYVKQTPYTDIAGSVWFLVFALFLTAMLLRWVRSFFPKKGARPELTEPHKLGKNTAQSMVDDLHRFMDARFKPAFDGYLGVLRSCFEKCIDPKDAPPIVMARIEYKSFLENVDEMKPKMLGDIEAGMRGWLEAFDETSMRVETVRLFNKYVDDFAHNLTLKGVEVFIEMADQLKLADDKWRATHPQISARFPPDQ